VGGRASNHAAAERISGTRSSTVRRSSRDGVDLRVGAERGGKVVEVDRGSVALVRSISTIVASNLAAVLGRSLRGSGLGSRSGVCSTCKEGRGDN
jgi:hypothetical protein